MGTPNQCQDIKMTQVADCRVHIQQQHLWYSWNMADQWHYYRKKRKKEGNKERKKMWNGKEW